ncbi:hypothetical protein, partial [Streptomyces puniciscabiei]|uniref:hypothetical protein n=1 Tax=Streptomyces puniciscabiei TaxID=164348 RepID=UPI001F2AEFBA
MSRALPKYNKRRVAVIGGAAAVALSGAVIAGSALAGTPAKSGGAAQARTLASPGTITCPDVAAELPAVPASAKAEVDRNLTLLQTQIQEANKRLQTTVGQGGPNFVNNAILGPLKDKRTSTIDRIAIAIGRTTTRPTGLDSLGCLLPHFVRVQAARESSPVGLVVVRPMAMAMRSMVEVRLSLRGPRMALLTKLGPPWPTVVCKRLLASWIWVCRRVRLRSTSALA